MHYHDECGAENNLSEDLLRLYRRDNYAEKKSFCHVKCVAKKIEVFDEQNGILVENVVHQVAQANNLTKKQSRKVVTKCVKEVDHLKSDSCVMVVQGLMCLFEHGYCLIEQGDVGQYESSKLLQEEEQPLGSPNIISV